MNASGRLHDCVQGRTARWIVSIFPRTTPPNHARPPPADVDDRRRPFRQRPTTNRRRCLGRFSQLKTNLTFRHSVNGERQTRKREQGSVLARSPTARGNAKTLFSGSNSPVRLDQVQNSHPAFLPRGDIMRLSSGRRTPRLMPSSTEAGTRRPIL